MELKINAETIETINMEDILPEDLLKAEYDFIAQDNERWNTFEEKLRDRLKEIDSHIDLDMGVNDDGQNEFTFKILKKESK